MTCLILVLATAFVCDNSVAHGAMNPVGATITQTMLAGPYKLVLDVGPLAQMYTIGQYRKMHPRDGEIMVSGTMVMGGMGMHGAMPNHHLELHIYDAKSGKTITKARVAITIHTAMGTLVEKLPIATMYGIQEGMGDFHYGNNVALKNGQYQVVTQVQTTTAMFKVTIGRASGGMTM